MSDTDHEKHGDKWYADKLFQDLITDLTILKKNIGIYPQGHSAISRTSEHLLGVLQNIFGKAPTLTIVATRNSLSINGTRIETKTPHIHEFALFLNQRGMASLTFTRGLSVDELQQFYRLALAIPPESHMHQHKDIQNGISAFSHINVREIDFSAVRLTDDDDVNSSVPAAGRTPAAIWQEFMLGSLPPEHQHARGSALPEGIETYDMGSFNRFLQEYHVPADRVAKSYDTILRQHFHAPAGQPGQRFVKQEFFRSLHDALPELTPELKAQILSITFRHIDAAKNEASLEELLCCMPGDMIIAVLERAKSEKREISPALIKLLGNLSRVQEQSPERADGTTLRSAMTWDHIQKLFSRERYEEYVPEEYDSKLHDISSGAVSAQAGRPVSFQIDEHMKTLQDESVNRHIASVLLALLEGELDEQAYGDFAGTISRLVPELLQAGDYGLLGTVYTALLKHASHKKEQGIRNAAAATLQAFAEENYIALLAEAFAALEGRPCRELEELLMLSGAKSLPWLLGLYVQQKKDKRSQQLFALLCRFGRQAAEEALKRLSGSSADQAVALLKLIQACGDESGTLQIRKMLESSHAEVYLEAIRTLLKFKDSAAVPTLRKLLHAKDEKTVNQALEIVREYAVQELALDLASLIKTLCISRAGLARNKAVLGILGALGNVNVLPALQKKALAWCTITPQYLRQTQEFLYKTLPGYPRLSIQEFVLQGLRSKNKNISSLCKKLTAAP